MIDVVMLTNELLGAGITTCGCNEKGVVWDQENKEIQDSPEVKAVIELHDPGKAVGEASLDEKMEELWGKVDALESLIVSDSKVV